MTSSISFETAVIDAAYARRLLAQSRGNRRISPPAVSKMTVDMLEGRWHLTAEPIQLDVNGRLTDGHHRLTALLRADEQRPGISIPIVIAHDVPAESIDVIDQGQPRSAAQVLAMQGAQGASFTMAAATRQILRYDRFPDKVWIGAADVSKATIVEFYTKHADRFAVLSPRPRPTTGAYCNESSYVALNYLVLRDSQNAPLWDVFDEGIRTGAHLPDADPRLLMRAWRPVRRWGGSQMLLGGYLKCWAYFVDDRPMKLLRFSRDELPMPKVA